MQGDAAYPKTPMVREAVQPAYVSGEQAMIGEEPTASFDPTQSPSNTSRFAAEAFLSPSSTSMTATFSLLFVCMGNICRSPCAESVMLHMLDRAGLAERVHIDSAGTGGWHEGEHSDARMRGHAKRRGYALDSLARQVRARDFENFDMILVMDQQNLRDIRPFAPNAAAMKKVSLFCDFAKDRTEAHVPDPYYDGEEGFEQVLDIVENGCQHLLKHIQSKLQKSH